MTLLGVLLLIIVVGVVLWAARALMAAFSIGEPIQTVIWVLLVIVILIVVLNAFGVNTGLNLRI
jgi:hypothetical protein